jgi:hypothetical protein
MSTSKQQAALYKEGRLDLAVQAYQRGDFQSYTAAVKAYDVPRKTLQRRILGVQPKLGSITLNRLLLTTEEDTLIQWILSMDQRGMLPRPSAVREMARLLLAERKQPAYVGKAWVTTFINRHDSIKSKCNRKYDYQRSLCEDPVLIRAWFERVQYTKAEYGILDDDTYNFDETGFQMGVISTAKVVTGIDRVGRPRTTQPGNRK